MADELKPFVVTVVETRKKPMIVWAEGTADASWKALSLCQHGEAGMESSYPTHSVYSVREAGAIDQEIFQHFGKEGSQ